MSFLCQFDSALLITFLFNKVPVFCLGARREILIYWGGVGGLRQEESVKHGCMISGFLLRNNSSFPQSFPLTQPGCWQLFHHDFCNDCFAWQGTMPLAATEKLSAPLKEAQYSLELCVTLVVLQKSFKNKNLSSPKAQVWKVC